MLKQAGFVFGYVLGKLGSRPKPEPDPPFDAWSIPTRDVLEVLGRLGVTITLLPDDRLVVGDPQNVLVGPNVDGLLRHAGNIKAMLQERRIQASEGTLLGIVGKAGTDATPPLLAEVHYDRHAPDGLSCAIYAVDDRLRVERVS